MEVLSDLLKATQSAFEAAGGGGGALGYVDLTDNNPGTPPSDTLRLFRKQIGGREMLAQIGPSGMDTSLQPHLGGNAIVAWFPAGNSNTAMELKRAAALSATGTATAANVAVANRHQRMKRMDYLVTTAATTAIAGWRSTAAQFTIGASTTGDGGFFYRCRFGPATGVATSTNRLFVGLASSTAAPTDVEPSSITNMVGVGWDAADANIQIMARGSGSVLKVDTGMPVSTSDRSAVFELNMFALPGTIQAVGVELVNLVTGDSFVTAFTTNLPSISTLLAPRGWMSAGGTSSVIGIALMGLYIETDY